jgi:multidrug efflux system outer membrane protein
MAHRIASTVALLLALGCAVGPDYEEPKTATAPAYEGAAQDGLTQDAATVAWWREFNDPTLDALIERALAGNRGVAATTALLREARALYAQETFNLAPTVTADASYTSQLLSNATFLSGLNRSQRTFGFFSAGFDAAWELDLFGRVRRSVEAADAEVGAADANRRDVVLSLLAEVARNYFELKGARYNFDVARKNAAIQEQTLRLTIDLAEGGRGTELDVARARAEHKSTLAILPPIETAVARAKNRLAVRLGVQPSAFSLETGPAGPPGPLPKLVAIGRPEDLLRRRPDIPRIRTGPRSPGPPSTWGGLPRGSGRRTRAPKRSSTIIS